MSSDASGVSESVVERRSMPMVARPPRPSASAFGKISMLGGRGDVAALIATHPEASRCILQQPLTLLEDDMATASAAADLQYPIGKFKAPGVLSHEQRQRAMDEMQRAPAELRTVVTGLSAKQLETPYRPGGWTVRQVVHHVPDSHANGYLRLKWALTEDTPTIKTYDEAKWAELSDSRTVPIETSLMMLDAIQERWVALFRALSPSDWSRTFQHPEQGTVTLDFHVSMYAWHGKHHVAHIAALREREGW